MNELIHQVIADIAGTLIGSLLMGIVWCVKVIYKTRRDLNKAFTKIRAIERELNIRSNDGCDLRDSGSDSR